MGARLEAFEGSVHGEKKQQRLPRNKDTKGKPQYSVLVRLYEILPEDADSGGTHRVKHEHRQDEAQKNQSIEGCNDDAPFTLLKRMLPSVDSVCITEMGRRAGFSSEPAEQIDGSALGVGAGCRLLSSLKFVRE